MHRSLHTVEKDDTTVQLSHNALKTAPHDMQASHTSFSFVGHFFTVYSKGFHNHPCLWLLAVWQAIFLNISQEPNLTQLCLFVSSSPVPQGTCLLLGKTLASVTPPMTDIRLTNNKCVPSLSARHSSGSAIHFSAEA